MKEDSENHWFEAMKGFESSNKYSIDGNTAMAASFAFAGITQLSLIDEPTKGM